MTHTPSYSDRTVRLKVTPDEWKRLKILAVENGQDFTRFITNAVQTSPLSKKAFQ